MVEDCTQLVLDGLEVNRRVGLSIFVAIVDQFILPADNLLRRDAAHFQLAEVGQQLGSHDMLFGMPSIFFCTAFHILGVLFRKTTERHVEIAAALGMLFTLPCLRITLGLKAALGRLMSCSVPVGVAVINLPGVILFVSVNGHISHRPSARLYHSRCVP